MYSHNIQDIKTEDQLFTPNLNIPSFPLSPNLHDDSTAIATLSHNMMQLHNQDKEFNISNPTSDQLGISLPVFHQEIHPLNPDKMSTFHHEITPITLEEINLTLPHHSIPRVLNQGREFLSRNRRLVLQIFATDVKAQTIL